MSEYVECYENLKVAVAEAKDNKKVAIYVHKAGE